ncbi:MAG: hypothetical protein APF78_01575 [Sphingomonadales bacterium BRH_c3]|nr:MAG: hypothetical protein APF78_01575 [Sphingomonadales bacterium BRH_c3]
MNQVHTVEPSLLSKALLTEFCERGGTVVADRVEIARLKRNLINFPDDAKAAHTKVSSDHLWSIPLKLRPMLIAVALAHYLAAPAMLRAQEAHFAEEIHVFGIEDEVYPPQGCETLFVGSSSFRFWFTIQQDFSDWPVLKRGFGGARISDINFYFDQVVGRYHPQRIAFYAGENDIDAGLSPEAVMADFSSFMDRKSATLGATPVFFVSAKPSLARWAQFDRQSQFNRLVEQMARERDDLVFVDIVNEMMRDGEPDALIFISDGLHMNAAGYSLWRARLRDAFTSAPASAAPGC